jgi:hypothetical protein
MSSGVLNYHLRASNMPVYCIGAILVQGPTSFDMHHHMSTLSKSKSARKATVHKLGSSQSQNLFAYQTTLIR